MVICAKSAECGWVMATVTHAAVAAVRMNPAMKMKVLPTSLKIRKLSRVRNRLANVNSELRRLLPNTGSINMIDTKFNVTFIGLTHPELAPLMATTKDLEHERLVASQGMDHQEVHCAFELLDLINAEFQTDPTSVQCFDLRIVKKANDLVEKWNKLGRP